MADLSETTRRNKVRCMDEAQNGRCCVAEHKVHLESVSHHKANLTEVHVIFRHVPDRIAAPLVARGGEEICNDSDLARSAREYLVEAFGSGELILQHRRLTSAQES
jgi:hypothetical protein